MTFTFLKKLNIGLFLLSITYASAQFTHDINTNRPSQSMGAYAVGNRVFQLEGGYKFENQNVNDFSAHKAELDFRVGAFFEQLEFIAQINYSNIHSANTNISGFENTEIGAKVIVYDAYKNYKEKVNLYSWKANQRYKFKRLIPAVSLYAGYVFYDKSFNENQTPNGNSKFTLITQQHLSKQISFITNIYAKNLEADTFKSYGYVATLAIAIAPKASLFFENQGEWNSDIATYFDQNFMGRGGFTYRITPNMQCDAFYGRTFLIEEAKNQFGIGFSWRNERKVVWKDPYENVKP